MNKRVNKKISNTENYNRITNFWIEVYKQERLSNPNYSYKDILRIILKRLKKYCTVNNLSFEDYQKYGIENKIHFGTLAKTKLSTTILNAMDVINSDVYKLISWPYTIDCCFKLIALQDSLKVTNRTSRELRETRRLANTILRNNSRTWENWNTQIIWDSSRNKSKPFFINYDTINLNKLSNEEKSWIKLICKRIKTENIDYTNVVTLTNYLDTLNKKWLVRDDVVHFIMSQCG